jgi:hypothetical protein
MYQLICYMKHKLIHTIKMNSRPVLTKFLFFYLVHLFLGQGLIAQTIRYVDGSRPDNSGAGTSWATAKRDLQIAINGANAGDQIWVKAASYVPTHDPFGSTTPANNRDKAFTLKEGVKVYGGFAGNETLLSQRNWKLNVTTLSGDLGVFNTLTDNSYHVVLSVNLTSATVLDGFTITKGYATAPWQSSVTIAGRTVNRYKGAGIYNSHSSTQFANLNVTQNRADCTDQNDDAWGAGMVSENSNATITDCLFDANSFLINGNSFGVYGAGLMIVGGTSNTVTKCVFVSNSSGSGIVAGSYGGGLYVERGSHQFVNCIFYGNSADNGAALVFGGGEFNTSSVVNCTFANNTSNFAGTSYSGFSDAVFRNCIFWNNNPTSSSVAGRNEIFSQESRPQFWPTFNNCIIRDASGSPLSVTNTVTSNILNGNPLFVNYNDGDGADDIWGTADDGLRLQCSSPAIGSGTGSTPTTDFLNLTRTTTIDMGAYEGQHANSSVNPLPTAATTVQISLNPTGANNFSNCTNLVASVQSGSPYTIASTVTAKVWIQGTQPAGYVRRHYEITPENNALTASGRVTLYFTQADFDAFNSQVPAPSNRLPINSADATGKQNLLVEKRGGTSSNGAGLPNTYSGTISTINPNDADIIWNSTALRWEVTFNVTGFSGFFIKTVSPTLPLTLVDLSATAAQTCNTIQWQTKDELNTDYFIIESSIDGNVFNAIGNISAVGFGNNSYRLSDCTSSAESLYYRLKMVDKDGSWRYSKIVVVRKEVNTGTVSVFPTITNNQLNIHLADMSLIDVNGKMQKQIRLTGLQTIIQVNNLRPGVYFLKFSNGITRKFIINN